MSLQEITYKDTIVFKPDITSGKVIKVYDGDTITIATKLPYDNSPFFRFSVRLRGIDCPEIRTKNANEKHCAKLAKELLHEHIYHKIVTLENVDYDKYGRVLADVLLDGKNVTNLLIHNKLAVVYDGGTKHTPDDWLAYYQG
jgi:endonuclease YncB( thermonuclease family)|tara:strand:- start:865 stop:1290 length:426 start_codon:yes stop_codon:yes gene_type:complete